jgi:hypothetical protein
MEDRRRTPRFPVRRPAILIVQGNPPQRVSGTTDNVSALGALVRIGSWIAEGTTVELVLNLKRGKVPTHYLFCPGKVVRTENMGTGNRVAIAISCDYIMRTLMSKPVV